jgi:hypothetical protein
MALAAAGIFARLCSVYISYIIYFVVPDIFMTLQKLKKKNSSSLN